MSISRTVYVRREDVPSPTEWAAAIRAAGFPMEMDTDFDAERFSGFLPCRYEGKEAGFEYFFSEIREDDEERFELPDVGDRDIGIAFVTHASMRELVTAIIAAAVLCEMADGVCEDEEAGEIIAAKDALRCARELIDSIGDDLD
jgi:hypothetical protein